VQEYTSKILILPALCSFYFLPSRYQWLYNSQRDESMKAPAEQSPEPQRQATAHKTPQQPNNSEAEFQFNDNRVETASLRQLQEAADNAPQAQGLSQFKP